MVITGFEKLEKEKLSDLRFPSSEVLMSPQSIAERQRELNRAMSLGNLEHSKISIYFEDETSPKVVVTTVWAVTDKRVILKQGVVIPIHRIHSVNLC